MLEINVLFPSCPVQLLPSVVVVYQPRKYTKFVKYYIGDPEFLKSFLMIHESCKTHGATPRRYMTFLHMYCAIHNSKRAELIKRQSHLQVPKLSLICIIFSGYFVSYCLLHFLPRPRHPLLKV